MSFIQRTLESMGLATKQQVSQAINRAYESGYYDGSSGNDEPPSGTTASYGYNRTTTHGMRDFTKLNSDQILNLAWVLYQSNALASRYLAIVRDHILGRGVKPVVEDEELRTIIETFWRRNNLDEQSKKFTIQLFLFGGQYFPAFVRQSDGQVTLGYIDPNDVEHIVTHPQNILKPMAVVLKFDINRKKRVYRIIQYDEGYVRGNAVVQPRYPEKLVTWEQAQVEPWEQLFLESNGLSEYTGSCFSTNVNNPSNMPRGFTDLLQVADWLDADDETLFAIADREQMAGYFSWVVKLIGADDSTVKTKASDIARRIPRKGQALVTNDKEEWTMEAPDLKQQASIATSEALSDRAWGMLGMPKPWRGLGDDSNRASAVVMGEPTRKTLENKQDSIQSMLLQILNFVRDQAEIAGYWTPKETEGMDDPKAIELPMPELAKSDMTQASQSLLQMTNALVVLLQERLVRRETAAAVVGKLINELGVEYDAAEELKLIDEEQVSEDMATAEKVQEYLRQRLNGK